MKNFFKQLISGTYNTYISLQVGLVFCLYSCLVVGTIFSVNERKIARQEIKETHARVAQLEIQYYSLTHALNEKTAATLGLVPVEVPQFAYQHEHETVALR